ncbi:hypothetical protein HZC53_01115 [Candidatus Uhrbacteria bacterium]|nr:hypothetical protein [Candidatus Uhrbacteria bacterium]
MRDEDLLREHVRQMADYEGHPAALHPGCTAIFQKRSATLFFTARVGYLPSGNRFFFSDGDDKFALFTKISREADCRPFMDIVSETLGLGYRFEGEDADNVFFVLT